jgi:hypothetical protein
MREVLRGASRELLSVLRADTPTHGELRNRMGIAFGLSLLIDLVGSALMLWAEHAAAGSQIHDYGNAIFWTTSQLTTLSSELDNPVTAAGKVIDVSLELYAITVVTTIAGSFAAFFHRRSLERRPLPRQSSRKSGGSNR